jgi:hypothetical protein
MSIIKFVKRNWRLGAFLLVAAFLAGIVYTFVKETPHSKAVISVLTVLSVSIGGIVFAEYYYWRKKKGGKKTTLEHAVIDSVTRTSQATTSKVFEEIPPLPDGFDQDRDISPNANYVTDDYGIEETAF